MYKYILFLNTRVLHYFTNWRSTVNYDIRLAIGLVGILVILVSTGVTIVGLMRDLLKKKAVKTDRYGSVADALVPQESHEMDENSAVQVNK